MLITVGSLMDLVNRIQNKEVCSTCNKPRTRLILGRKSGQYRLNFVCPTCFSKTTWVNSSDWRQPGVLRKFADSMTLSGINYWQYKRMCQIMNLHYFNSDQWRTSYLKLYPIVTDLNDEYMEVRKYII